jgi:hypothetical protein
MTKIRSAVLLGILALATVSLIAFDQTQQTQAEPYVVETTTTTSSTTTTTIDLSFLNTTTTTSAPATSATSRNVDDFFECIRWRESRGNYEAVNSTGTFMGAYQIYQGGWDTFAARIDRHDLIGVPPHTALPTDQDAVALAMYNELGAKPWNGACQ